MKSGQIPFRPASDWRILLLVALSLAIGWGIRGNFGHEYGAMIPGALAAMAAALLSGREDWYRRIAWFGMFGALGWSFGGSMSYGQVIGYTHSGHSASVLYGFASLFVIGFLWGAIGGAGTVLPAVLSRERLRGFLPPLIAVFIAWFIQDIVVGIFVSVNPQYRQESPLYWYDTDWLAAATAIAAILLLSVIRRKVCDASSLILHMAAGWWLGFTILVLLLDWRMTPPRSDNWAGCVGMTIGLWVYLYRNGLGTVGLASLITAFFGGFGFASATFLRLSGIWTGGQTNWHSFMEQSYGFINGLGIAVSIIMLASLLPKLNGDHSDSTAKVSPHDLFAIGFVLLAIPWVNLRQNPEFWIRAQAVPETMMGIPAQIWFEAAFFSLSAVIIALLIRSRREPLWFIPQTWIGRGQLLYLVFLWMIVAGNFEREIVVFRAQRLITEWVIFLNAAVCSYLLLSAPVRHVSSVDELEVKVRPLILRIAVVGMIIAALSTTTEWIGARTIYGDQVAGGGKRQIRFGTDATATREKPKAGQPHP